MMRILQKTGYKLKTKFEEGAYEVEFRFEDLAEK